MPIDISTAGHHHVDDEEWDEDDEADLEGGLQLRGDEGRDEDAHRQVVRLVDLRRVADAREQGEVGAARTA
jgi:hypothetical protein